MVHHAVLRHHCSIAVPNHASSPSHGPCLSRRAIFSPSRRSMLSPIYVPAWRPIRTPSSRRLPRPPEYVRIDNIVQQAYGRDYLLADRVVRLPNRDVPIAERLDPNILNKPLVSLEGLPVCLAVHARERVAWPAWRGGGLVISSSGGSSGSSGGGSGGPRRRAGASSPSSGGCRIR